MTTSSLITQKEVFPAVFPSRVEKGPLPTRVANRFKREIANVSRHGRKLMVKGYYALPGLSAANPRKNIVRLADACARLPAFPPKPDTVRNWQVTVRNSRVVQRVDSWTPDSRDADLFERGALQLQGGKQFQLPEVFLASVANGVVRTKDALVTQERSIFLESALDRMDVLEQSGILDTIGWPSAARSLHAACLLSSPWSGRYYYHWLIDALPRLSSLESFPELSGLPLLVTGPVNEFQRKTLSQLGLGSERVVEVRDEPWKIDRLYFPSLLSPTGHCSSEAVAWLRSRFLNSNGGEGKPSRLIYVSRRDASQRRVLNEDEIVAFLEAKGFEVLCPGSLPFEEQVALFREARVIIGPHGAAFSNIVFAPKDATLIELFGDNYVNGCFWTICNVLGQKHGSLTGPSSWLDFAIPLSKVEAALRALCPWL